MTASAAAQASAPRVLFGGTFDPVHRAHISCARAVSRALGGAQVHLLPNAVPPHRPQPAASPAQRLAMLELAVADHPALAVDARELAMCSAVCHHWRMTAHADTLWQVHCQAAGLSRSGTARQGSRTFTTWRAYA